MASLDFMPEVLKDQNLQGLISSLVALVHICLMNINKYPSIILN